MIKQSTPIKACHTIYMTDLLISKQAKCSFKMDSYINMQSDLHKVLISANNNMVVKSTFNALTKQL